MNYETRQLLGEILYSSAASTGVSGPSALAGPQPRLSDLLKMRGFILRWYGAGRTEEESVANMVKAGNGPANRLEDMGCGPRGLDQFLNFSAAREYGHWGYKNFYIPTKIYFEAAQAAWDLEVFITYLHLIECTGFSHREFASPRFGIPIPYQGAIQGVWDDYVSLVTVDFQERLAAFFAQYLGPIMMGSHLDDLQFCSRLLNFGVNALTPDDSNPASPHFQEKNKIAIVPHAIRTPVEITITYDLATTPSAGSARWKDPRYMWALPHDFNNAGQTYRGPLLDKKDKKFNLVVTNEVRDFLLIEYDNAYKSFMEGKMYDLAARVAEQMDATKVLSYTKENLDPTKNPFLVYDAAESKRQNKVVYRNMAKSLAMSKVPQYVIPGVTVDAPDLPIASPEAYAKAGDLISQRLRMATSEYGLRRSSFDTGGGPEKSSLLPWLLAGVAAVAVVKGVTG
jgi:hypothetical protein